MHLRRFLTFARPVRRRGFIAIYTVVMLVVLLGFVSFSVDYGRVQLAKEQLQTAADAAARAAVSNLASGITTVQNTAVSAAAANTCNGTAVAIDATNDVEFGTWDGSNFTVLTGSARSSANAVRVTTRRTAAKGNAIPLVFAGSVGRNTCDVVARATAVLSASAVPTGFTSLNSCPIGKKFWAASYNSSQTTAPTHSNCNQNCVIASNGTFGTGSHAQDWIYGNVSLGPAGSLGGGINVTGTTSHLGSNITVPSFDMQVVNNPGGVSRTPNVTGNVSWPGGTYYFTSVTIGSGCTISFQGAATVYLDGDLSTGGGNNINAYQKIPANLAIYQAAGHTFTLKGADTLVGVYDGPGSTLSLQNGPTICGAAVAQTFNITDNVDLYFDESLSSSLCKSSKVYLAK